MSENLVTGGEGFVGRKLVDLFNGNAQSYDIVSGFDINDLESLDRAFEGKKRVAHLAALISVGDSHRNPDLYHHVNVEGTEAVVKAAIKAGCESLLFFSSAAAKDPENSPYGRTKFEAENILKSYRDQIHIAIFRPENIFGPGQNRDYAGVITAMIDKAQAGEELQISGDGEQSRDFIYVGDIAELAKRALLNHEKIPSGTIFEVGTGTSTTVNELAEYLINRYGVDKKYRPDLDPGILHSRANNGPILEAVGPMNFKGFTQGLEEIIDFSKNTS